MSFPYCEETFPSVPILDCACTPSLSMPRIQLCCFFWEICWKDCVQWLLNSSKKPEMLLKSNFNYSSCWPLAVWWLFYTYLATTTLVIYKHSLNKLDSFQTMLQETLGLLRRWSGLFMEMWMPDKILYNNQLINICWFSFEIHSHIRLLCCSAMHSQDPTTVYKEGWE